MNFGDSERLWLLVAVIALAIVYVVLQRRRQQYAVRFTNVALLEAVAPKRPGWRRHAAAAAFLVAIACTVVAFARPTHDTKVPREKATVVVAIDTSLSMQATDIDPTRIDAVKSAATAFVNQLPSKINVGLVSFDGNARLEVSPTTDRSKVRKAISGLELHESTAIGEAIFTSLNAIKQSGLQTDDSGKPIPARIVLMSDGKTTVGRSDDEAIAAAQKAKVPVSTIAFGTDHGSITIPDSPDPVEVPVDKAALQKIAEQTGGQFFTAASASQLQQVYANIGSSIGFDTEQQELTTWFIGAGLLALLATAAMSLAWFNRLP